MNKKVLLSIEQRSYRELLQHTLQRQPAVELVGQSCSFIECLAIISQHQPQVWIHSATDNPDLQSAVARAYELAPKIVIVQVNPDEPAGFLQMRMDSIYDVMGLVEALNPEPTCTVSYGGSIRQSI